MPQKRTVPRVCRTCGIGFLATANEVKRGNSLYCSGACRDSRHSHPVICSEDGKTALIPLGAADGTIRAYATIDGADAEWAEQWRWSLFGGYAQRADGKVCVTLHRELLGLTRGDGIYVDHIDRDRLNCRRSNLRTVTRTENMQNFPSRSGSSSQYRGVYWKQWKGKPGKWAAVVSLNKKPVHLGYFTDEQEAAATARRYRLQHMPGAVD